MASVSLLTASLKFKRRVVEREVEVMVRRVVSMWWMYSFWLITGVMGEIPNLTDFIFPHLFSQVLGMSFALTLNCQIDKSSQVLGLWPTTTLCWRHSPHLWSLKLPIACPKWSPAGPLSSSSPHLFSVWVSILHNWRRRCWPSTPHLRQQESHSLTGRSKVVKFQGVL